MPSSDPHRNLPGFTQWRSGYRQARAARSAAPYFGEAVRPVWGVGAPRPAASSRGHCLRMGSPGDAGSHPRPVAGAPTDGARDARRLNQAAGAAPCYHPPMPADPKHPLHITTPASDTDGPTYDYRGAVILTNKQ
jgi:hypothetical protein